MQKMSKKDLLDVIRLVNSENVGIRTFWHLIHLYKTASNALDKIADLSIRGGRNKPIKIFSTDQAEKELERCESTGVEVISYLDAQFPQRNHHALIVP